MLRDHGPRSPSVLLTLYTIATFMDRTGRAYPSQQSIAKGIRGSVKTVQRHIEIARREGWLCVETAGRGGKGWRHYAYRAAVPNRVQLDDLDESVANAIESQQGGVEGGDTIVSPRKPEKSGCPTDVHRTKENDGVRHHRGDTSKSKVATNGADGGDISGTSWRHNSVALTPALRTPAYITRASEEAHNAQSRVASPPPDARAREKMDEKIADRVERVFLEHTLSDIELSTTSSETVQLLTKLTRFSEPEITTAIERLTAAGRLPIKRRGITPREDLR